MKKIIILIIVILVVALVGIWYLFLRTPNSDPIVINPIPSGDVKVENVAQSIIVEDKSIENRTANRDIKCVYPVIKNLSNKSLQNLINTEIAENIQAYRNEIEYLVDEETSESALYKYTTSYERYNSGKYLSLVISQDYQTGGIRSNTWKDIYNINAETERLVYLSDLFEAGFDYESAIISEIEKQASAKNIVLMGGEGISKLSAKQKYYISNDKIYIYFDPSEVAATKFGELCFEMPFVLDENDGYFKMQ